VTAGVRHQHRRAGRPVQVEGDPVAALGVVPAAEHVAEQPEVPGHRAVTADDLPGPILERPTQGLGVLEGVEGVGDLGGQDGGLRRSEPPFETVELATGLAVATEVGQDGAEQGLGFHNVGMLGQQLPHEDLGFGGAALLTTGESGEQPGFWPMRAQLGSLGRQALALPEPAFEQGPGPQPDQRTPRRRQPNPVYGRAGCPFGCES